MALGTGLNYHLREWNGDADARHTVLLVHGFLDSSYSWQGVIDAWLANHPHARTGLHFVAPDMRGHGDSGWVDSGGYYHFLDYLADLREVVSEVCRDRLSLVGHSMGGTICSYYAGTYPDSIHRLVLMEGMGPLESSQDMPTRVRNWLAGWRHMRNKSPRTYDSLEAAAEQLMRHDPLLARDLAMKLAEHGTRVTGDGRISFKHDPLHLTPAPYPFQLAHGKEFWNAITCPVMFIEGSASTFRFGAAENERRAAMFATGEHVQGGTRRFEFRVIDGAAHMMQRHKPVELAALLDSFVSG